MGLPRVCCVLVGLPRTRKSVAFPWNCHKPLGLLRAPRSVAYWRVCCVSLGLSRTRGSTAHWRVCHEFVVYCALVSLSRTCGSAPQTWVCHTPLGLSRTHSFGFYWRDHLGLPRSAGSVAHQRIFRPPPSRTRARWYNSHLHVFRALESKPRTHGYAIRLTPLVFSIIYKRI